MALVAASVFLFSYMAALCLEVAGKGEYRHTVGFYTIAIGLSIAASLAFLYVKRNRFFQTLMDIDSRLNLNDTIATAYEYETRRKSSVFPWPILLTKLSIYPLVIRRGKILISHTPWILWDPSWKILIFKNAVKTSSTI